MKEEIKDGLPEPSRLKFRVWNGDMMSEPFYPWQLVGDGFGSVMTNQGVSVWWPKSHGQTSYRWMQFTGLKDKSGRDIYEGDVVKAQYGTRNFPLPVIGLFSNSEVAFRDGMFTINGIAPYHAGSCEVIGNIYENSDLLGASARGEAPEPQHKSTVTNKLPPVQQGGDNAR